MLQKEVIVKMQSLPKLIRKRKISGNEKLDKMTVKYFKKDQGYGTFVNYISLVQKNLGSCDLFAPCYKMSRGGLNA